MKRNIVICCEAMLRAIGHRDVVVTAEGMSDLFSVTIRERSGNRINNCPWCGTELPFPYQEGDDEN